MLEFLLFFITIMISSAIYAVIICKIPDQVVRETFLWTGMVLIICGFGIGIIFLAI